MTKFSLFLTSILIHGVAIGMKNLERSEESQSDEKSAKKSKTAAQELASNRQKLSYALTNRKHKRLEELLREEPELLTVTFQGGDTLLHKAAEDGSVECVEVLLKAGALVEGRNERQRTPLHAACRKSGQLKSVTALLAAKAQVEARDRQNLTPLHVACQSDAPTDCVRALIDAGADVNALAKGGSGLRCFGKKSLSRITPLHIIASSSCDRECMSLLLTAGTRLNAVTSEGKLPEAYVFQCGGFCLCNDVDQQQEGAETLVDARIKSNAELISIEFSDARVDIPRSHIQLVEAVAAVSQKKKKWYRVLSHDAWNLILQQMGTLTMLINLCTLEHGSPKRPLCRYHQEKKLRFMQELCKAYAELTNDQRNLLLKAFADLEIPIPTPILLILQMMQEVGQQFAEPEVRRLILAGLGNLIV